MSLVRIARSLGLSVTTVSRALGGYSDVAATTRDRILAEAERIAYQPNRVARALRQGRSAAVGLVLPTAPGRFDDPFFLRFLAAVGPRLARASLDLLVMAAPPGAEEMRAYRHLVEGRRVDGVLLARTRVHDERVEWLQARGIPFVIHGRTGTESTCGGRPYAWVDVDGAAAFSAAVHRVAGAGHRCVAMLNAPSRYFFATNRAAGWRAGLAACRLPPGPMLEAEPTEENGYDAARDLLGGPNAPTALLCATDRLAIGALRAVSAAGLRAGRDVSVIGYDDLPAAGWVRPALTTFAQPIEEAAVRTVELLLRRIAGEDPAGLNALLQARLIVRDSDGPAPTPTTIHPDGGSRDTAEIRAT
jgi:LacI family transcriptional regulator